MEPRRRRRVFSGSSRWLIWSVSAMLGVAVLVLAQVAATEEWIDPLILPAPTDVWNALKDGFRTGLYWPQIESTMVATLAGFAIANVLALTVAAVMSTYQFVRQVTFPYVVAFQTVPIVATAPIIILWLGFGQSAKIAVVVLVVFFPVLVTALQGFALRDRDTVQLFQSLGASRLKIFTMLRFPGSIPFIFAGFRVGIQFSLIGAVVAEFLGSQDGLGYLLLSQKAAFNVPGEYAVLVILMVLGLALNLAVTLLERVFTPWSPKLTLERE